MARYHVAALDDFIYRSKVASHLGSTYADDVLDEKADVMFVWKKMLHFNQS